MFKKIQNFSFAVCDLPHSIFVIFTLLRILHLMAAVKLHIPVLVRQVTIDDRQHYHLRPLFIPYPVATNRQFKSALSQLQKEIRDYFRGFTLTRDNVDQLIWFQFYPDLRYKQHEFEWLINKQYTRARVGTVVFELRGHRLVHLPDFGNFMFMASTGEGAPKIKNQVEKVARRLLEQYREEQVDFQPENYFSDKREFITDLKVNVQVEHGPTKFQASADNRFFALFKNEVDFNGAIEIEKVGYDLNSYYPSELKRAFYLDEKVEQVYRIIFQRQNTPLAIVGPEGVGKHTLMHEVTWRYESKADRKKQEEKQERIWHIDPTRIIAGMSVVGWWEKRFEAILGFVVRPFPDAAHSDKILIDNPIALLRIGRSAQSKMTLSDVLKPYLEKRRLQLVLLATPEEWKVMQEKDRRFSDLFQVLRLQEPDVATAGRIVLQQRRRMELDQDTQISIQAIRRLFTIQRNYLRHKALPGSVMSLLQQLVIKYRSGKIDAPEVRENFQVFSGLRESIFDESRSFSEGEVLNQIRQQLIGQPEAARALADVVHLMKARLTDRSKPLSSFLFIGPTGVGKTQAAKVLCRYLMSNEKALLRFDMNEYIDADAAQRLLGDEFQPEGLLTGRVRYHPFSIILFDEIEKAHPKVHDLLLQVLDDGRLTDSLGRTVDFTNAVVIMTSNIGAKEVTSQLGYRFSPENEASIYRKAVEKNFRPEFINRIDKLIVFKPLQIDHILRIARLQIKELLQRDGFVRRTTILNISQNALEWVARRGFDSRMGGRALKRQIERDLTALSAEQLTSSYTNHPIILDILLEEDRLQPRITELQFVDPLPESRLPRFPEGNLSRHFYQQLLQNLEEIAERVQAHGAAGRSPEIIIGKKSGRDLDWLYYDFTSKIAELRDRIQTIMLGFRDKFFTKAPAIPLRLKRSQHIQRRPAGRSERENLRDRLFQEEGLREISEAYQYGANQFDSLKSEFIDHYLDVAFLQISSRGLLDNRPEQVLLSFRSLITGLGDQEIDFLFNQYHQLFTAMDLPHQLRQKSRQILVEGYALSDLLRGETGIHLFYQAHRNPLPVQLLMEVSSDSNRETLPALLQVIRIYDGANTLTDLRTGYSNAINSTPHELKLLLYAGIDPGIRKLPDS